VPIFASVTPARSFAASVLAAVLPSLAVACSDSTSTAASTPVAPSSLSSSAISVGAGADVKVCHAQGNGGFRLITTSENALRAHLAHGDGFPGQAVPGDAAKAFDETCGLVPVAAVVVFSNLGPGDTYAARGGWTVYGSAAPLDTDRASPFVPLADYVLDSIQIALTWSGGTNAAQVWLMSDAGDVPGTILETFEVTNLPAFGTTDSTLATASSIARPVLSAGVQYWLAVSATSDGSFAFNTNVIGQIGLASRDNSGPWGNNGPFAAGAFRIYGRSVPQ
jgi:hypothetical protein